MLKKLLVFVVLINALQPIMVYAEHAQKSKHTKSFAPSAGVAACTTGALCAAAGYSLSTENPYIAGGLLLASAATPLAVEKFTEFSKNESLTTQEAFQLGFADFFATVGASAALMYFFAEKPWLKGGLLALCAAKSAYLLWRASQLSKPEEEEEEVANIETSPVKPVVMPQEIKVVTPPVAHTHKPHMPTPSEMICTYPWFGDNKPDHKDAFVLMSN